MRFKDQYTSKESRYSLGVDGNTGKNYLSIPVSNGMVDYDEYYELSSAQFEEFLVNAEKAVLFANECRLRKMDHLLILKPGKNRGDP